MINSKRQVRHYMYVELLKVKYNNEIRGTGHQPAELHEKYLVLLKNTDNRIIFIEEHK